MQITSTTIGIPVSDLATSRRWYEATLQLDAPELEPADGIVEYEIGGIWLQLSLEDAVPGGNGIVLRFGVADVFAEHARLEALAVDVTAVMHIEGVIDLFDVTDPDGNTLSLYTEAA